MKQELRKIGVEILEEKGGCFVFLVPEFNRARFSLKKSNGQWVISDEGYAYLALASKGYNIEAIEKILSDSFLRIHFRDRDGELMFPVDGNLKQSLQEFVYDLKQVINNA